MYRMVANPPNSKQTIVTFGAELQQGVTVLGRAAGKQPLQDRPLGHPGDGVRREVGAAPRHTLLT
ncbi:hypothetical protein ACIRJO_18050 [Streptomyces sp. NPDC102394]|uniref:hypothetical protein n=1 Tax=Streptomyces sp. NPDC102394 TaxID=3366167 RepID=UPI0037F70942